MNLPELRFKKYTKVWDKKNLLELSDGGFTNGVFNDPSKVGRGYKLVNVLDMYIESTIDEDRLSLVDIPEAEFNKNKVETGDIFFTRSSLVKEGIAHSNTYLGNSQDITFDGHLIRLRPKKDLINSSFLNYLLKTSKARSQLIKRGKTATMTTIGQADIASVEVLLPAKEEQTKIASFLTAVDEKIAQITQKCELIAHYKKGVMQQIFSQELRFKDDDGKAFPEWHEKCLSSLGSSFNGLTGKSGDDFGIGMPYVTYKQIFDSSTIDTNKFSLVKISDNERQNKVQYGDVFFTTSSETPEEVGFCSALLAHVKDVYLNSFCFGYRIKSFEALEPNFARFLFKSPSFRRDVIKLAQGSTRYNISKTSFMEITIQLPCIKEQSKIANFFTVIDDKLTHTQNQLAAAKQYKQGLLQQMFV